MLEHTKAENGEVTEFDMPVAQPYGPVAAAPLGGPPVSVQEETEPAPRGEGLVGRLAMAEWLLKHRDHLLAEIAAGREVQVILKDLLFIAIVPTALYGLVTGLATGSWMRILTNPIKLPLVIVFTMSLCLPTLYIFSCFLGSRRSLLQTAALGFTGVAIMGVVLAAFAPITWFLTFTAPQAYPLHVIVNVAVLAIAGTVGIRFMQYGTNYLHRGTRQQGKQGAFLGAWMLLYALVGAQMGWLLRPFFSPTMEWVRARDASHETVFGAIWELLMQLLR